MLYWSGLLTGVGVSLLFYAGSILVNITLTNSKVYYVSVEVIRWLLH